MPEITFRETWSLGVTSSIGSYSSVKKANKASLQSISEKQSEDT